MRGLKLLPVIQIDEDQFVAPYVGAWIETHDGSSSGRACWVAPYVGAWIETWLNVGKDTPLIVAPYVGAWIETRRAAFKRSCLKSRTLRGCVD